MMSQSRNPLAWSYSIYISPRVGQGYAGNV